MYPPYSQALGLTVVAPVYDTQLLCEVRTGDMWRGLGDAIDTLREAFKKADPSYAAMAADAGVSLGRTCSIKSTTYSSRCRRW
jgi:hypothetical protein